MRILFVILAVTMLSGCSLFMPGKDRVVTEQEPFTLIHPNQPDPINMKDVEFMVSSKKVFIETLMEKFGIDLGTAERMASEIFGDDTALFSVNTQNYENLGENMQEIIRFLKQQREVVQYYRDNVPAPGEEKEKQPEQ